MSFFQLVLCLETALAITSFAAELRFNSVHNPSDEIRAPKFYILTSPQTFSIGCATNVTVIVHRRFGETLVTMKLIEEGSKKVLAASETFIRWYEKGKPKNIPILVPLGSASGYGVLKIKLEGSFTKEESITVQIKRPALKTLIKTEKYGYYANEKVRAWIFVFDRKLLPYSGKVDLVSSEDEEGEVIFSQNNVELTMGSASIEFPLPPNATLGKYVLKAKIEGQEATVSLAVLWKPPDGNTSSAKKQDNPKNLTRQRVKKELRKIQRDLVGFNDPKFDDTYSKTSSFVSIIKPDYRFKVNRREGIVVIYNNPTEGINHFFYQIKCKGDVVLSRPYKDLYSSFLCLMGLPVVDRLDVIGGPSRRYLCRRRSTKFRLTIQVTPEMVPFCSLVVYRIVEGSEIVADSTDLETEDEFLNKVFLEVDKFDVSAEEEMTLKLKGKPGSQVYLHGQKWVPVHRSRNEDVMEEREVLQFLRSSEHGTEVASLIHQCKAMNIKTTKQIFQDIGLMVRSSLETDPIVFCAAYNKRPATKDKAIRKRNVQKQNSQYTESFKQPWVWKEYTLKSGELTQILRAPSEPGIWYVQATSMSQEEGLGMSEFILVQVSEKPLERSNSAAFKQQYAVGQEYNITVAVKAFNFLPQPKRRRCRSLYLEICLHVLKSHVMADSSAVVFLEMKNAPGFAFVESQIEKMLMTPKKTYFAYQLNQKSLIIRCKGCLQPCMDIALKQTDSLQEDNREGQVSIRISNGASQSLFYTITDEVCFGF